MIKVKVDNPTEERQLFNLSSRHVPPGLYENKEYYIIVPEFYEKRIALWIWKNSGMCYSTLATEVISTELLLAWRSDSSITISN